MIETGEVLDAQRRWRRAAALGEASARHAAVEAFQGCAAALCEINRELRALDYPVSDVILPCDANLDSLVRLVEQKTSLSLPPPLIAFWKAVGGVALVDIGGYAHVEFWDSMGVRAEYCDGLSIEPCTSDWVSFVIDDYESRQNDGEYDFDADAYFFELAPDGYHKDDISGGLPYGLRPGSGWLPDWENFSWVKAPDGAPTSPIDFVSYLRFSVLECAGFPGLFGDPAFEPVRQHLLKNIKAF